MVDAYSKSVNNVVAVILLALLFVGGVLFFRWSRGFVGMFVDWFSGRFVVSLVTWVIGPTVCGIGLSLHVPVLIFAGAGFLGLLILAVLVAD